MKLLNFVLITLLSFFSITSADTMNSIEKNPSMAVTGTQRVSAAITNYVIPTAVSGAACNSATDTVAVTSDHSSQLICQSGVWKSSNKGNTTFYVQTGEACPTGWSETERNPLGQWGVWYNWLFYDMNPIDDGFVYFYPDYQSFITAANHRFGVGNWRGLSFVPVGDVVICSK